MKIFLIRHGETTGDIEDKYGGDYDDHLTDEGKLQSETLANKLADKDIEILFYSPLLRAKETALIVQNKLQCQLEMVNDLRERNKYGILTGMIKAEAKEKYPELVELLGNDHNTINGAELYEHFQKRTLTTFNTVTSKDYQTIGIVSHGGPIKLIVKELFTLDVKNIKDCGFIEIEKNADRLSFIDTKEATN